MRIAYIVPSLANKAPVTLALQLANFFSARGNDVEVFYFDNIVEQVPNCKNNRISMSTVIDFDSFDIIHTHMLRPDKFIYKHKKRIKTAKTVSTIHCNISVDLAFSYGRIISLVYTRLWKRYLRIFDTTVQISNYLMDVYKDTFKHNTLIYNSVNVEDTPSDELKQIEEAINKYKAKGLKVLCSYSGIIKRKGLLQILKAMAIDDTLAYVCIGDGPIRSQMEAFCKDNNLCDRVSFFGFTQRPYLVLKNADIFCIPSYSEGFSLALLEAGTIGSSVVCSNIASFNRVFTSEEVSFFELENIGSLIASINVAYEQKEEKTRKLKERINKDFSQEIMFSNYEELYNRLLDTRNQ